MNCDIAGNPLQFATFVNQNNFGKIQFPVELSSFTFTTFIDSSEVLDV